MQFGYIKKKRIVITSLIVFIIAIGVIIVALINTNKSNIDSDISFSKTIENAVNSINQNYYEIKFDKKARKAVVDGTEVDMADFLQISNEDLNVLLEGNNFETMVQNDLLGNVEQNGQTVSVENPYSTNSLIVEADNKSVFNNYPEITSVEELGNGVYILNYDNAYATKYSYSELQKNKNIKNIITDTQVHILDDHEVKSENDYTPWGKTTTGVDIYSKKVEYLTAGKKELKVAVLDTGINANHEAFEYNQTADRVDFSYAYDYINNDSDPSDDRGHGTQVAGVIASSTPYNVKIMPIKVLDEDGKGSLSVTLRAINAIYKHVDIINLSLGAPAADITSSEKSVMDKIFKQVYEYGTMVVCAAGNESTAVNYPASSQYTIAVSAVDSNSRFTSFSCFGEEVDFAMPGKQLILPTYNDVNSYVITSGTSFSCPYLAAAAALVKLDYSYNTVEEIKNVLIANCEDLGDVGKDIYYGYGLVKFRDYMFDQPDIIDCRVIDESWNTKNSLITYALCGNYVEGYAITNTNEQPEQWVDYNSGLNEELYLTFELNSNGTKYFWIEDSSNNVACKEFNVQYVDNSGPIVDDFNIIQITDSGGTAQLTTLDNQSGISKIKWYYKKKTEPEYISSTITYGDSITNQITKIHRFSGLENDTEYNAYAEIYDLVGNITTTETIEFKTSKIEIRLVHNNSNYEQIKYNVNVENYISGKKTEFEQKITTIMNNNWGLEIQDYDNLFLSSGDNYCYITTNGVLSELQVYYNEDNLPVNYYNLYYDYMGVTQQPYIERLVEFENKTLGVASVEYNSSSNTGDFQIMIMEGDFYITSNQACVVLISLDGGQNYSILEGTVTNNQDKYKYSLYLEQNAKIMVALKGDVNLNGKINTADIMLINRSLQVNTSPVFRQLTAIESLIADIDKNGVVNLYDAITISFSLISNTSESYQKISW